MKNSFFFVICLYLIIITHSKALHASDNLQKNPNLKYFGYALTDVGWDDPNDAINKTNYIDEVAAFTNIADLLVTSPEDNIKEHLALMNRHQIKAILHLSHLFFKQTGTGGKLSGHLYNLRPDYKQRWNTFIKINNLNKNNSFIQAFYIGEEPTWNGISYEDLKSVSDYIKSTIPQIPILIIEASPAIDKLRIPTSVDWIGFDHYFIKKPDTDKIFLSELALLKSKHSSPTQKTVLVMDAHHIASVHGAYNISENDMKDIATRYYNLAKADLNTVALIAYFWPGGFDNPASKGSRNLPKNIRDEHIRIGKEITRKR